MSKRIAYRHKLDKLKINSPTDFAGIDMNAIELYLDTDSKTEIIEIISLDKNKFRNIIREILLGRYNNSLYRKEAPNVGAMKFIGKGMNARIYCQEITGKSGEKKKIIMSRGFTNKTSQKNNKTNQPIIDAVSNYDYELRQQ